MLAMTLLGFTRTNVSIDFSSTILILYDRQQEIVLFCMEALLVTHGTGWYCSVWKRALLTVGCIAVKKCSPFTVGYIALCGSVYSSHRDVLLRKTFSRYSGLCCCGKAFAWSRRYSFRTHQPISRLSVPSLSLTV